MYCICQQVYCISICYHVPVLQEPHLGELHLLSSVLQRPSCTSEASLGCTAFAIKCTAEAIMYFRSFTWVYCRGHHLHQEPHFGVRYLPSRVQQPRLLAKKRRLYTHTHKKICTLFCQLYPLRIQIKETRHLRSSKYLFMIYFRQESSVTMSIMLSLNLASVNVLTTIINVPYVAESLFFSLQ